MKDYYSVLEINESASNEVIDKVHKLLVKKYHPDLQKQEDKKYAEEKMKEINEAYEVLTNPVKRQEYDVELKEYKIQEIVKQIKSEYKADNNNQKTVKIYNENIGEKAYLDENEIRRLAKIYYEELYNVYNQTNGYYTISFKQRVKTFFKNVFALLITIGVIYLVLKIPFVRGKLEEIINDNIIAKAFFGRFFE